MRKINMCISKTVERKKKRCRKKNCAQCRLEIAQLTAQMEANWKTHTHTQANSHTNAHRRIGQQPMRMQSKRQKNQPQQQINETNLENVRKKKRHRFPSSDKRMFRIHTSLFMSQDLRWSFGFSKFTYKMNKKRICTRRLAECSWR